MFTNWSPVVFQCHQCICISLWAHFCGDSPSDSDNVNTVHLHFRFTQCISQCSVLPARSGWRKQNCANSTLMCNCSETFFRWNSFWRKLFFICCGVRYIANSFFQRIIALTSHVCVCVCVQAWHSCSFSDSKHSFSRNLSQSPILF